MYRINGCAPINYYVRKPFFTGHARVFIIFPTPGPPTNLAAYRVMTNRFLLTWKPPEAELQNGVIQSYYIEIIEPKRGELFNDTTNTTDPFFLTYEYLALSEGHTYTFRVAAYTNKLGKFSDEIVKDIPLPQGVYMHTILITCTDNRTAIDAEETTPVLILSIPIGLLSLILIVVTIVTVTVCNRMRKRNKSLTRYTNTINFIIMLPG